MQRMRKTSRAISVIVLLGGIGFGLATDLPFSSGAVNDQSESETLALTSSSLLRTEDGFVKNTSEKVSVNGTLSIWFEFMENTGSPLSPTLTATQCSRL
jgi:hypothetical protein